MVFADLVLPGELSGLDLARRVQEVHPNVHVILTSGYSAELMSGWGEDLDLQVLPKPYRQADLARIFREALQTRLPRGRIGQGRRVGLNALELVARSAPPGTLLRRERRASAMHCACSAACARDTGMRFDKGAQSV